MCAIDCSRKGEIIMFVTKKYWSAVLALGLCVALCMSGCGRRAEPVDTNVVITDPVSALEMEIGAADIRIEEGAEFRVTTDNPYITVSVRGETLVIREEPHAANLEGSTVTVYCPNDTVFARADIEVGAGVLRADILRCGELDLELGAGLTDIASLTVTGNAEITGGAGEISIRSGSLNQLDLELGMGKCAIRAALSGNAEIEAGVGKLDLTILGSREDYTIRTERGLGAISIDGQAVGGGTTGSGPNRIQLVGGVGDIDLRFEE